MNDNTNSEFAAGSRFSYWAAVVVFIIGFVGWVLIAPLLDIVIGEWVTHPGDAGDAGIGIAILAFLVIPISIILLVASIVLNAFATGLPRWFRVLAIASPIMGLLVGAALFYRA